MTRTITTRPTLPAIALLILGGLAVVGVIALCALSRPVPDLLPQLATLSAAALAGLAVPGGSSAPAAADPEPPAPDDEPPAAPAALALVAAAADTGSRFCCARCEGFQLGSVA